MVAQHDGDSKERGWIRANWLAEKIASGELPAPGCALTRRCDELFVGHDRLEDHASELAGCLSAAAGPGGSAAAGESGLLVYVRRLLQVREMWSRERS